jgi:hypothetical protein
MMTMTICVVFERLNAVRALSGRPPIPPQPWRHRRTDQFDAELTVTCAELDFLGPTVQNPAHDDKSQPSAGP